MSELIENQHSTIDLIFCLRRIDLAMGQYDYVVV